jgi:hypothetical protein
MGRDELAALAAALLAEGRAVRITARGGSMAPFIRDGDAVLIESLRTAPRPGEVVLVRGTGGALALHRVVLRTPRGVVTRGDATAVDDEPVGPADLLGRAAAVRGSRRLHLRAGFGRLVLHGLALRRWRLAAGPLRTIARAARNLAART